MNYIVYLIHIGVIGTVYFSLTYTVEFTDTIAVRSNLYTVMHFIFKIEHFFQFYYVVGFTMLSYGIAFVGTLTIEYPFVSLERILLGRK